MVIEQQTVDPENPNPDETTPEDDQVVLDDLFPQDPEPTKPAPQDNKIVTPDPKDAAAREAALLSKVQETVRQTIEQTQSATEKRSRREQEITTFLTSDKGKPYVKYAKDIAKVATDPRFADLSMNRIVGLALTDDVIIKIGARMGKEADEESRSTELGGSSAGGSGEAKVKDVWDMPDADFAKMQADALAGKFLKK